MLEADIRETIEDANDMGHFFMIMEHKGYEIRHGNRLSFRLRGQERFMCPGRKNPLFTEDGILAAIEGNWDAIEAELKPAFIRRPVFVPYPEHPKYTGLMALYVHYLYILGKIEKREYPPRMTPQMRRDVMRFEQLREQFWFLRDNGISTMDDIAAYEAKAEESLAGLMKQRTILNVRKKRRRKLYTALADVEELAGIQKLYSEAVAILDKSGINRTTLKQEKAGLYNQLSEVNREIRDVRKELKMCAKIKENAPKIERYIQKQESVRQKKEQRKVR